MSFRSAVLPILDHCRHKERGSHFEQTARRRRPKSNLDIDGTLRAKGGKCPQARDARLNLHRVKRGQRAHSTSGAALKCSADRAATASSRDECGKVMRGGARKRTKKEKEKKNTMKSEAYHSNPRLHSVGSVVRSSFGGICFPRSTPPTPSLFFLSDTGGLESGGGSLDASPGRLTSLPQPPRPRCSTMCRAVSFTAFTPRGYVLFKRKKANGLTTATLQATSYNPSARHNDPSPPFPSL